MNIYKIHKSYSNPYENHCLSKELFPNPSKVLFQQTGSRLLIISDGMINVDGFLIEYIGNTNEILRSISGDVAFSIRLNAAKANGHKRVAVFENKINEWVDSKLNNIGVVSRTIRNEGIIKSERKEGCCFHSSVLVSGFANNIPEIKKVVETGIGSGKAFGFGLLNIFDSI